MSGTSVAQPGPGPAPHGAGAGASTTKNAKDFSYADMVGDAAREIERLQVQHRWLQMCFKDQIAFAPVDLQKKDLKVLDMGCADGTLLRDLRKQVPPSAEMVGADVSTVFMPTSAQGNIRYVTQDVCDPPAAELRDKFDFTHVRNVLHSSGKSGVEKAVANLVDTLAPGGWLQVMEMDISLDPSNQPQSLMDFITVIGTMFETMGMDRAYQVKLPEAFEKAGLQNVKIERRDCGIGRVHGNEEAIKTSIAPFLYTIPLLIEQFKAMCPDKSSVYEDLEKRYVKEMTEKGGVFPAVVVYGQKPPVA